jgi:hypothetical protein
VRDGLPSADGLLPRDHREMLLERAEAFLQGAKHRESAIGVMSGLSQLVDDLFLPRNTSLKLRDVPLGLCKVLVIHARRVAQVSRISTSRMRARRNIGGRPLRRGGKQP